MRFKSIQIKNYRQYGTFDISFEKQGEYDLHIIQGINGVGKTNLLNAVNWCLYADEPHLGIKNQSLPKYNVNVMKEASSEYNANIIVEVTIIAEDNESSIVYNRSMPVNTSGNFEMEDHFTVTVTSPAGDSLIYADEDANIYVNKYLPQKIRKFFFFDGEQLNSYFIGEDSTKIKESIHAISQVDVLTRINDRLEKSIQKKQADAGAKSPDIKKITSELENLRNQLVTSKNSIGVIETEINLSETAIQEINERLKGQDNLPELEKKYQEFMSKLTRVKEDKLKNNDLLMEFVKKYKVLLTFYPFAKQTLEFIIIKEKQNELPPEIDKSELLKMLDEHQCSICGNDLDSKAVKKINGLISKIQVSSKTSHTLMEIKSELLNIINESKKYKDVKKDLFLSKKRIETEEQDIEKNLQLIDNERSKFTNKEQVLLWHKDRITHKNLKSQNTEKLGVEKNRRDTLEEDVLALDTKLEKAMSKQKECSIINAQVRFASQAKVIVEQVEQEMMTEVRSKMESKTMELFLDFIWKENTFKEITLDEDYNLELYHNYGYPCLGSCSAAERSLLAMSFTLALHEVSGFDSLLFIDTPVARVSDKNRANFANVLKNVSKNKQIIMTLTPDENSLEIQEAFVDYLSNNYSLSTSNESQTNLVER